MQRTIFFISLLSLIGCALSDSYVRFFNPLPDTLTITTDVFSPITLSTGQASAYMDLTASSQQFHVTNAATSSGDSTNGIQVYSASGNLYYTFVAGLDSTTIFFMTYNSTFDSSVNMADSSLAFVEILDLSSNLAFINLVESDSSAVIFQYVGTNTLTAYKQIPLSDTHLEITTSNGQTINVPTTSFVAGSAYTIAVYNSGTSATVEMIMDRVILTPSTTGSSTSASTSVPQSSSVISVTPVGSVDNNDFSSSSKVAVAFSLVSMAILAVL